eukprot:355289-Pelagomonas_calceolata.AAC.3
MHQTLHCTFCMHPPCMHVSLHAPDLALHASIPALHNLHAPTLHCTFKLRWSVLHTALLPHTALKLSHSPALADDVHHTSSRLMFQLSQPHPFTQFLRSAHMTSHHRYHLMACATTSLT